MIWLNYFCFSFFGFAFGILFIRMLDSWREYKELKNTIGDINENE